MSANAATLRVSIDQLHQFSVRALEKVGVTPADAATTADVLVTTDSWGVFTHGVKALRHYIHRLRGGGLRPQGRPAIVREGPAWATVDGDSALGMVTSKFAMHTAIAKARACGIAYVGVRNSCHFGAAGYYAALAAEAGMIGLAMANDIPSVTAPGARGPITGSNPLAYAVPTGLGWPIMLDMAVSVVAGGKVAAAYALGQSIPAGWVVDSSGQASTDPAAFLHGGCLLPMGAHKGYGIALLIETLSAVLTGAQITRQVAAWMGSDPAQPTGHGAAFIAVDIGAMQPLADFRQRVDALVREIHASPTADGVPRLYLPGEMEWQRRERALAEGIELPPDVVESVQILARDLDLPLPGYGHPA